MNTSRVAVVFYTMSKPNFDRKNYLNGLKTNYGHLQGLLCHKSQRTLRVYFRVIT